MQEIKFNIYGEMFHQNGYSRMDILSYIAPTQEEAIANCKRNNPGFHVMSCWIDESKPEVVRPQRLIWPVGEVAQDFGTAPKIDYLRGVEGISLHKRSTLFIHA